MARAESSTGASGERFGDLPLVLCRRCGLQVVGDISYNERNPGRAYYKCPNNQGRFSACKFYMWENQYIEYLKEIGVLDAPSARQGHGRGQLPVQMQPTSHVGMEAHNRSDDAVLGDIVQGIARLDEKMSKILGALERMNMMLGLFLCVCVGLLAANAGK